MMTSYKNYCLKIRERNFFSKIIPWNSNLIWSWEITKKDEPIQSQGTFHVTITKSLKRLVWKFLNSIIFIKTQKYPLKSKTLQVMVLLWSKYFEDWKFLKYSWNNKCSTFTIFGLGKIFPEKYNFRLTLFLVKKGNETWENNFGVFKFI